jgi:Flp pilus assembly protein TadG
MRKTAGGAHGISQRAIPWRCRRGVAALEFCVIAPMFILMLAGLIDLGNVMWLRMRLEASVSAATNVALQNPTMVSAASGASLASNMASVLGANLGATLQSGTVIVNNGPAVSVSNGVQTASGTAANANSCYCPSGTGSPWTWGSAVTCASACANGAYGGKYVTVAETQTYQPLFSTYGMVKNNQVSASAIVQVQ